MIPDEYQEDESSEAEDKSGDGEGKGEKDIFYPGRREWRCSGKVTGE